jgi:hypothetical protein
MTDEQGYTEQERIWGILYAQLENLLRQFGKGDGLGRADHWLLDDNYGGKQHKLYVNNLDMLAPQIVKRLQASLSGFPDWEIVVAVDIGGAGESWPQMGLIIRRHEVIDGLQRQYFPKEFQGIRYEGSRPGAPASAE